MSDVDINPFDAPQSDLRDDETVAGSAADLRNIVAWQRTLVICLSIIVIAAPLELVLASVAGTMPGGRVLPVVVSIATICVVLSLAGLIAYVIGIFSIYRLSTRLWGTILGSISAIASIAVPVGLLMTLIVHICTTRLLKSHGLKVGRLWTEPSEVERWGSDASQDTHMEHSHE